MGEYAKVQKRIWNSNTFNHLTEDAKFLWLYLLTCPHGNILGMFVLKSGYAKEDLQWSQQRFKKAFNELLNVKSSNGCEGLIEYDEDNNLLLIKNFLEHNPIKNPNQTKAAIKKLSDLPFSSLFQSLKLFMEQFNKPLYKELIEQLSKPVTVAVAETVTVTATETIAPCPHDSIIRLWNRKLAPKGLPKVRAWGESRKKHLNARWKEIKERQNLGWWERLFEYIPRCSFLMGKVDPAPGKRRFYLTLHWLVSSEENLSKVQEGFYEDD